MPTFKNLNALFSHIEKQVADSLKNDVAIKAEEQLKDSINSEFYNVYEPEEYKRTYELRESVDSELYKDVDSKLILEIFNNVNEINPYSGGQHTSWVDDSDQSAHIPEWSALGHGGIWTMPERDYFDHARQQIMNSNMVTDVLKKSLNRKGIKVI